MHYLYQIENLLSGKKYIGISKRPDRRKRQHFGARKNKKTISLIAQAIDKYGRENFEFKILCAGDKSYILDLEVRAITLYQTTDKKFGYNIRTGGQGGAGFSFEKISTDIPQYVSGFWFPNPRTAQTKLNISSSMLQRRRKAGTLGDVCLKNLKYIDSFSTPQYVFGFWWPNLIVASASLGRAIGVLSRRIRIGTVEQAFYIRDQAGDKNHMTGIDPKDHPSAVKVIVDGVLYTSIKEATAATGYSKYIINSRIKSNTPGFSHYKVN